MAELNRVVAVTGASGFIGTHACRQLRDAGFRVRALMRRPAEGPWDEVRSFDLGGGGDWAELLTGADALVHAAIIDHLGQESGDHARAAARANIEGSRRLLQAAQTVGIRRGVFISSVKAMAETTAKTMSESSQPRPSTVYGRCKLKIERLFLEAGYVREPVVLRPAAVYGPDGQGNINQMLDAIAAGRFPPLPETGNRRSMVHVLDLAQAILLALIAPAARGKIYIVTDGQPLSTRQIYLHGLKAIGCSPPGWQIPLWLLRLLARIGDLVQTATGLRSPLDSDRLAKLLGNAEFSNRRIAEELGFNPRYSLPRAMPQLMGATKP